MKKVLSYVVVVAFVFGFCSVSMAADLPRPVEKIKDGTVDVIKSPLVIYDHTKAEMDKSDFKAFGLVKGLIESPFHLAKKAGSGVLEIATFPIE